MPEPYQQYKVLQEATIDELEQAVNRALRGGWDLIGGAYVHHVPESASTVAESKYVQAMAIRRERPFS